MELLKSPVAGESGVSGSMVNDGTRGMKKTRRIPTLNDRWWTVRDIPEVRIYDSRDTQTKDEEDGEPPGEPASA